jgi:hypothetical protein
MDKLFLYDNSGKILVKFYKVIGEYSETWKNLYEITVRHPDNMTGDDIETEINNILSLEVCKK